MDGPLFGWLFWTTFSDEFLEDLLQLFWDFLSNFLYDLKKKKNDGRHKLRGKLYTYCLLELHKNYFTEEYFRILEFVFLNLTQQTWFTLWKFDKKSP